jgi:acyl dehydratase
VLRLTGVEEVETAVGADLGWTEWFEIDQGRVDSFAHATRDDEWIHVDVARASADPLLGGTIVHGFLTLGMLGFFIAQLIEIQGFAMGVNYGVDRVRFPARVATGESVRCHASISECEQITNGIRLRLQCTVEVSGSTKPCCVATVIAHYYDGIE